MASAQAPVAGPSTNYPTKSVRILVGFATGGGIDISARFFAKHLTESLAQSLPVQSLRELIKSDIVKWGKIVRETGAKVD